MQMLNQRNIPFTEKIAVIGAGPSGMACAYYLAEKGYPVTVFDRNPVPGGMLMLGIPSFRLEKEVVNAEIEILSEMGVKFQCGVEVGKDVTIAQLREQGYCGFYVAIGAQRARRSAVRAKRSRACLAAWISCAASISASSRMSAKPLPSSAAATSPSMSPARRFVSAQKRSALSTAAARAS